MTLGAGFLLLLWVVASILVNGIALLHYLTKLRGLELVGYGAGAGVFLHALLGWTIAAAPAARYAVVATLLALTLLTAVYCVARRVVQDLCLALSTPAQVSLGMWFLLLVLCLGILHLDVRLPEPMPDGLYVFKTPTTNVKVQYLTSLPADNYIPFAVEEFFLRGISFKKIRPILPINEVSNRTIMMSLVALPFRVALGAPRDHPRLGTYRYVGRDWPDVAKLNTNGYFEQFIVIGLVLNSFLLLGLLVFCSSLGAHSILPLATLLYITNNYFISQTVYTWPKALAGFFILLAWTSMRSGHSAAVVAALMALAYHAHPYAIVFAGCVFLYYLMQWRHTPSRLRSAVLYFLVFLLLLLPWVVWTRFVLHIPSDLMAQNFSGPNTEAAWASPINFVWIRVHNLFNLLCSTAFAVYPFNLGAVVNYWMFCLPGIVGIVMSYPALAQCVEVSIPRPWLWYGLLGPGFLIVAIYSCPALPVLHGYQPLLGTLLFLGVWWLSRHCSRTVYLSLVALQLALNLGLVFIRGMICGVHLG